MYGDLKKQFVKQLRKHLSFICLFFAIVAAVAFTGIAGPAAAEDNGGTLRLINPEIFLKDIRIKHIVATLDGADFGGCWADRRQPNNLCIKPQPISNRAACPGNIARSDDLDIFHLGAQVQCRHERRLDLGPARRRGTILRDGKKCALGAKADRFHDC